jgi:cobyrinic acid a,c-diamide synthase
MLIERPSVLSERQLRIGIPRDAAFGFYYPDDLQALNDAGAELVFFDSLHDGELPEVDGLFIGGGFPETHMHTLEQNASLRSAIKTFVESNKPVYAECGGLMYLARSLSWGTERCQMVGALPLDIVVEDRPVGRGYVSLQETGHLPWGTVLCTAQGAVPAHEFHYSRVENIEPGLEYAYRVTRGYGIDGQRDGIIYRNTVASYAHLRDVGPVCWAQKFVDFVRGMMQ